MGNAVTYLGNGIVKVTDLDTAIYILWRARRREGFGIRITDVIKVRRGEHHVLFADPKNLVRSLELEFANGATAPCIEYAGVQRDLKRLLRKAKDTTNEGHRQRRNNKRD
jgi:hypothetical protein